MSVLRRGVVAVGWCRVLAEREVWDVGEWDTQDFGGRGAVGILLQGWRGVSVVRDMQGVATRIFLVKTGMEVKWPSICT